MKAPHFALQGHKTLQPVILYFGIVRKQHKHCHTNQIPIQVQVQATKQSENFEGYVWCINIWYFRSQNLLILLFSYIKHYNYEPEQEEKNTKMHICKRCRYKVQWAIRELWRPCMDVSNRILQIIWSPHFASQQLKHEFCTQKSSRSNLKSIDEDRHQLDDFTTALGCWTNVRA